GEGTTLITPIAGSVTAPVHVTFVRRGDYGVRLFVVWEGRAHISFQGLALADEDLGTVTLPEGAPYHVAEIRALLRTTPGRRSVLATVGEGQWREMSTDTTSAPSTSEISWSSSRMPTRAWSYGALLKSVRSRYGWRCSASPRSARV